MKDLLFDLVQNRIMLLFVAIVLILLTVMLHRAYLGILYRSLYEKRKSDFRMDQLKDVCYLPQGTNFNTMAIVSWNLLFISMAFLFFLTPDISDVGLLRSPLLASNPLGIFGFGTLIAIITFIFYVRLPRIYGFYEISKTLKMIVFYVVPLLLLGSMILSVHLGIIYPDKNELVWAVSYLLMILGEGGLVFPIIFCAGGGIK